MRVRAKRIVAVVVALIAHADTKRIFKFPTGGRQGQTHICPGERCCEDRFTCSTTDSLMPFCDRENDVPSFYIHQANRFMEQSTITIGHIKSMLAKNPRRVSHQANATIIYVHMLNDEEYACFLRMPPRSWRRPYLLDITDLRCGSYQIHFADTPLEKTKVVHGRDNSRRLCADLPYLANRTDVVLSSADMAGMDLNDDSEALPGVTYAPVEKGLSAELQRMPGRTWATRRRCAPPQPPNNYVVAFRGDCNRIGWNVVAAHKSTARTDLKHLLSPKNPVPAPRWLAYECSDTGLTHYKDHMSNTTGPYLDRLQSLYFMIPLGDDRYTFKLYELMAAAAVPVVIADGLTMPFDTLIDWSHLAVFMPEERVRRFREPAELLGALPSFEQASRMRQAVCQVYDRYFGTVGKRIDAMLLSAARLARLRGACVERSAPAHAVEQPQAPLGTCTLPPASMRPQAMVDKEEAIVGACVAASVVGAAVALSRVCTRVSSF